MKMDLSLGILHEGLLLWMMVDFLCHSHNEEMARLLLYHLHHVVREEDVWKISVVRKTTRTQQVITVRYHPFQ